MHLNSSPEFVGSFWYFNLFTQAIQCLAFWQDLNPIVLPIYLYWSLLHLRKLVLSSCSELIQSKRFRSELLIRRR